MYWKALLITLVTLLTIVNLGTSMPSPQFLGFGGLEGDLTPRKSDTFPAYALDPNWAASSGTYILVTDTE